MEGKSGVSWLSKQMLAVWTSVFLHSQNIRACLRVITCSWCWLLTMNATHRLYWFSKGTDILKPHINIYIYIHICTWDFSSRQQRDFTACACSDLFVSCLGAKSSGIKLSHKATSKRTQQSVNTSRLYAAWSCPGLTAPWSWSWFGLGPVDLDHNTGWLQPSPLPVMFHSSRANMKRPLSVWFAFSGFLKHGDAHGGLCRRGHVASVDIRTHCKVTKT